MLHEIANRGDENLKQWVTNTVHISTMMKGRRQVFAKPKLVFQSDVKNRSVYDAKNKNDLPGTLVRKEGQSPSSDLAVDEAYDGAGWTYDLYRNIYKRNSVDDHGMQLESTVHFGKKYDNAFWNGDQMVYGDGDGVIFDRFTKSIDVIGHELTHGITQYTANLEYHDQSGALNEHISDVFGSLVKQYSLNQTAKDADWLIGSDLFTPKIHGQALRSMKAPGTAYDDPLLGKDPQPADMSHYVDTSDDDGGVHINSGIPNKAFYLVASGIGGFAWEKAGKIWYFVLEKLDKNSDFQDMADNLFEVAGDLYGSGSLEQESVRKGWSGVGITVKR